jgi:hypothetical protein
MTLPRTVSKIPIPLFGGVLYICRDRKTFERTYKHIHGEDYPENTEDAAGLACEEVHSNEEVVYLLGVFDNNSSTILHEVVHTSVFILKRASINPTDDKVETLAYLIEFLYAKVTEKVFALPKKNKSGIITPQETIKDKA